MNSVLRSSLLLKAAGLTIPVHQAHSAGQGAPGHSKWQYGCQLQLHQAPKPIALAEPGGWKIKLVAKHHNTSILHIWQLQVHPGVVAQNGQNQDEASQFAPVNI